MGATGKAGPNGLRGQVVRFYEFYATSKYMFSSTEDKRSQFYDLASFSIKLMELLLVL